MQKCVAVAGVAAFAVLLASPAVAAGEEVRSAGQITYVSGGVGDESMERVQALSGEFNLKLLFANRAGEFLADIAVAIKDPRSGGKLDAVAEGPWFLAKLAPGKVNITAACNGASRTVATTIPAAGQREVVFRLECGD